MPSHIEMDILCLELMTHCRITVVHHPRYVKWIVAGGHCREGQREDNFCHPGRAL